MSAARYGYCCRPKLRGYIERVCFDSVRLWFSLKEDAVHNATSSNPRQIHELLRHIVEQGDPGHRYLRDLRRELSAAARLSRRPPSIRRRLRQQIEDAPLESFQPERMRCGSIWAGSPGSVAAPSTNCWLTAATAPPNVDRLACDPRAPVNEALLARIRRQQDDLDEAIHAMHKYEAQLTGPAPDIPASALLTAV